MTVRDMPTARRPAGLAYAAMHDTHTVSEVAMQARLAVWRFIDASRAGAAGTILRSKVAPA